MTAAVGLPPITISEAAGVPHTGGLYSAATMDDRGDDRVAGGVLLEDVDDGAHGMWPAGCLPAETDEPEDPDAPAEPENVKGGLEECPPLTPFPATVVWASDHRMLVGVSEEEARLAAARTLYVTEQVDTETHTAALLADRAGTPATAVGTGGDALVAALGAVEAGLEQVGVVHAPRSAAALAASKGLITERSGKLYTPLGNRWAFGVGYRTDLAGLLVATGPVLVTRSPVTTSMALNARKNTRLAVSERHIAVTWTGPTVAAAIA
ncbi:hypothetical protein K3888_13250 [Dietzia aurantiaca]|uniref:hypothetical protein n=1 Tax=Dietzia aurantiaca TaxID=983873 RepID=UPI001E3A6430|nr:hypothetical protein [Dietzia aurantiaca]MCD2263666.1 hypothetical protein [Dietzia aurantiaca]